MTLPAATLVVCTRNRPGFVQTLVESVLEGDAVPAEIVIVDQSDAPEAPLSDRLSERGADLVHVPSRSRGLSAARNVGIRSARHPVLVFADDDMIATPTWYRVLLSSLVEAGERTVVTGQVRATEPEVRRGFAPSLKTGGERVVYAGRLTVDVLYPNNMALFRLAIEEVGGFDERLGAGTPRFPGAEDNDFGFRLLEAGYRIVYEPNALLYHRAWRARREYLRLQWRYARGQGGFYAKHLSIRDRFMLRRLLLDIGTRCRRIVLDGPRWPRAAAGHAVFITGLVVAAAEWLVTHRLRASGPAAQASKRGG